MNQSSSSHPLTKRLAGRNLYLIGMMGCGKSRTGPPLAKELAYSFVDVDEVIERLLGKSIPKIFEEEGERGFREIEAQVLNAIGQRHSLVVATGGGVVTRHENWGVLHQGIVIWLDLARDDLLERLKLDSVKRPLLETEDSDGVFDALLNERRPLYLEADLQVIIGTEEPEFVVQKILESLPSILRSQEDLGAPQTTSD